jgi:hypothetical protein
MKAQTLSLGWRETNSRVTQRVWFISHRQIAANTRANTTSNDSSRVEDLARSSIQIRISFRYQRFD